MAITDLTSNEHWREMAWQCDVAETARLIIAKGKGGW
jgi:hypothetical protein